MSIEFTRLNAMRVPSWRWERARLIAENAYSFSRRLDDQWIRRAWHFRTAQAAAQTLTDFDLLALSDPALYWAHDLHNSIDDSTKHIKFELQARLLARQSFAQIRERSGYEVEVIECYAHLFFDVMDRINFPTFVMHRVIGPAVHLGLHEREFDVLWKLYAYFCGSYVLEALVNTFTNPHRPTRPDDVAGCFADTTRNNQQRKAMIASHVNPINPFTANEIQMIWLKSVEIERNSDSGQQAASSIMTNIRGLMDTMPWSVSEADVTERHAPLIAQYDEMGAELRMEELMDAATGEDLPYRKQLEDLRYPEVTTLTTTGTPL